MVLYRIDKFELKARVVYLIQKVTHVANGLGNPPSLIDLLAKCNLI